MSTDTSWVHRDHYPARRSDAFWIGVGTGAFACWALAELLRWGWA